MKLTKYRLGDFVELRNVRNSNLKYGVNYVRGVNNLKLLMPTKADLSGRDLGKFQIVYPDEFVFNHRTSRNGSKFSIAYNDTDKPVICTEDYVVFCIKPKCQTILDARWLYMFFNRPEFDRYVITNSWGSSTEFYNWEDICEVELPVPDIGVQQKYVDIYNAMLKNQRCYESGLEDLKLVCDAYIEELSKDYQNVSIGQFIFQRDLRNDGSLGLSSVRGIATSKEFITTKADMEGVRLNNYKIVAPGQFAYVPDTSRRGNKISLALNTSENIYLVSSISIVFDTQKDVLLPEYLMLFFGRSEFDRYARFHSWGSARETFDWSEMCDVQIPIPDIKIQQYIVNIYTAYLLRKEINQQLKTQVKDVCPILIKGSLEEAENG